MKRMIAIVDLKTGEVSLRPSDTSTLDVPVDFDRDAGVASLVNSRAHYFSTAGRSVVGATFPRPLSWRVRGEECLVANRPEAITDASSYTLSAVDPGQD
jgi:hypothetical protein